MLQLSAYSVFPTLPLEQGMPQHTLVGEVSQITASSWLSPTIPAWVSTWQTSEVLYIYLLFLNLDSVSQMTEAAGTAQPWEEFGDSFRWVRSLSPT